MFIMKFSLFFSLLSVYYVRMVVAITLFEQRSLVFVFDTTGSMGDDLTNFKLGAKTILDNMAKHKAESPIHNYILVPFNDPGFGPAQVLTDETAFRRLLDGIKVDGGGDCEELCFSGLYLAIEKALTNSYIFVMTDATEKDGHLLDKVVELAQIKKCQVMFLIRGGCTGRTWENYEKVADKTSGLVFALSKSDDIYSVLKFVNKHLNKDKIDLGYYVSPKGYNKKKSLPVDESLKNISVVVSGKSPQLDVIDPSGKVVKDNKKVVQVLNLPNVKAVDIIDPETGEWTFNYGSDSHNTMKITGVSNIKMQFGFSYFRAEKVSETTSKPFKGVRNTFLLEITKGAEEVRSFDNIELVDKSGNTILSVPLKKMESGRNLYVSPEFASPDDSFYITINGIDKSGNNIKRTGTTAIEPKNPEKPIISMSSEVATTLGSKVELICKVESLIPISIMWLKGDMVVKDEEEHFQSAESAYIISNVEKSSVGTYSCMATNNLGTAIGTVKVIVPGVKENEEVLKEIKDIFADVIPM